MQQEYEISISAKTRPHYFLTLSLAVLAAATMNIRNTLALTYACQSGHWPRCKTQPLILPAHRTHSPCVAMLSDPAHAKAKAWGGTSHTRHWRCTSKTLQKPAQPMLLQATAVEQLVKPSRQTGAQACAWPKYRSPTVQLQNWRATSANQAKLSTSFLFCRKTRQSHRHGLSKHHLVPQACTPSSSSLHLCIVHLLQLQANRWRHRSSILCTARWRHHTKVKAHLSASHVGCLAVQATHRAIAACFHSISNNLAPLREQQPAEASEETYPNQ